MKRIVDRVEVFRDGEWHALTWATEVDLVRHLNEPSKLLVHGTPVKDDWRVWAGGELVAASAPPLADALPRPEDAA